MLKKIHTNKPSLEVNSGVAKEISLIILLVLLAFTFLSVKDNIMGVVGSVWRDILLYSIGLWGVWIFLGVFGCMALCMIFKKDFHLNFTRWVGIALFFISTLGYIGLSGNIENVDDPLKLIMELGGYVGFFTNILFFTALGDIGTRIVLFALLLISLLFIFQTSFRELLQFFFHRSPIVKEMKGKDEEQKKISPVTIKGIQVQKKETEKDKKLTIKGIGEKKEQKGTIFQKNEIAYKQNREWKFPSLDLLDSGVSEIIVDEKMLQKNAEKIEDKLMQFSIPVTMKDVHVGPTVMQYTLEPDSAVKLSKITALKNDLALALAAKAIRIEAPIPGKSLVGIEIPNEKRIIVRLREILESKEYFEVKSSLRFPLGKDVSGAPVMDALDFMPHLLIAGSTGSGKSVAINSLLISLLYQNSPKDLKLILVDPKRVELSSYQSIPHLLTPVITDPDKAINALRWTVGEMTRRYKECQSVGARNRDEYNKKSAEENKMPYIIFVVDELADLMMTSLKKEVETLICRIAQMARAVGIHLVIATQRPSVDVITGLIKANIPARVAFSVVSNIDSRTILDSIGAEDLIGKGDMLYVCPKLSKPIRIQGAFLSSDEIERVTREVRMTIEPDYNEGIISQQKHEMGSSVGYSSGGGDDGDDDALVAQAIAIIRETGKASASLLQRRLKLGYARAARIIDILEERGIVGPAMGSKAREIYIDMEGETEEGN